MKAFSMEIKKAMQVELEDVMKLKEDLIIEKAKFTALKGTYELAAKELHLKKREELVERSIDKQNSLNKLEDFQIAQIIEQNSQHIWDILNGDENLDLSKYNDNAKTAPNNRSFAGRNVFFEDLTKKKGKNKKKNKDDSKFEYCLEEDVLTYKSSLHSAKFP